MRNVSSFKRIFSPPKAGIGICLIVMFAMSSLSIATSTAAARADLPDKVEKAVCASPDYTVSPFQIVSETSTNNVAFVAPFTVKSAANQEDQKMDLNAAKNSGEDGRFEDLQATLTVPPLISVNEEINGNVLCLNSTETNAKMIAVQSREPSVQLKKPMTALVVSLNVIQFVATADLEPGIQLKRPINVTSSAMVSDYNYEEDGVINQTATAAKAAENGQKNVTTANRYSRVAKLVKNASSTNQTDAVNPTTMVVNA